MAGVTVDTNEGEEGLSFILYARLGLAVSSVTTRLSAVPDETERGEKNSVFSPQA